MYKSEFEYNPFENLFLYLPLIMRITVRRREIIMTETSLQRILYFATFKIPDKGNEKKLPRKLLSHMTLLHMYKLQIYI